MKLGKELNFEAINLYNLLIKASDGLLSSISTLTLQICNVNEPPSISNLPKTISIDKDTIGKKLLMKILIEDEDLGENHFFNISSTNPINQINNFTIDAG